MKIRSIATISILIMFLALAANSQTASTNGKIGWEQRVIDEVMAMELLNAEMEAKGQVTAQFDLLSDDYVYIDIAGKRVTKKQLVERREEDERKSVKNTASQLEVSPLSPELALARGRWDGHSEYYGGLPRISSSRFMALWKKENGKWKILADQATPIDSHKIVEREKIVLGSETLSSFAGSFQLENATLLKFELFVKNGNLVLTIPSKLDQGVDFFPSKNGMFFANKHPWEIEFDENTNSITFISWGNRTKGNRLK